MFVPSWRGTFGLLPPERRAPIEQRSYAHLLGSHAWPAWTSSRDRQLAWLLGAIADAQQRPIDQLAIWTHDQLPPEVRQCPIAV